MHPVGISPATGMSTYPPQGELFEAILTYLEEVFAITAPHIFGRLTSYEWSYYPLWSFVNPPAASIPVHLSPAKIVP